MKWLTIASVAPALAIGVMAGGMLLASACGGAESDEDVIRETIRQGAAAMGIEDLQIESVEVRGDRAIVMIAFTENGQTARGAVVLEKVDGHWSTDPTQWSR